MPAALRLPVVMLADLVLTCIFVGEATSAPIPVAIQKDVYGDPLPHGAVARIGTSRLRNASGVDTIALSHDGKFLVTADYKRPLRVWDTTTGALVREIPLPKGFGAENARPYPPVNAVLFTADDRRLHAIIHTKLFACDFATGEWSEPLAEAEPFCIAEVSANGTHLICSYLDKKDGELARSTEIFAMGKYKPLYKLDEEKYGSPLALTDNYTLLTTDDDNLFKVWDLKANKELFTLRAPVGRLFGGDLSPDGKSLIAAYGSRLRPRPGAPAPDDPVLCKWDLATGKELFRVAWEGGKVQFSPDGRRIIGFWGTEVLVADATTGKLTHRLKGHGADKIASHAFSADGKKLVTGGCDHTAIIWDLTTGKAAVDFESPRGPVDVLAYSPDGETLFVGCEGDHTGGLWDPETGKRKSWLVADGKGSPLAAAFTPDSKQVVVGYGVRNWDNGKDWTARLWSVSDGKVVREFAGHTNGAHMLAISPDGKQLATCDSSTQIRLWELGTGKLKREIDWAERGIRSAIAFPKADKVIGVTARSGPEVVDLLSGESLKQLKSQHQASSVIFTPDGQKIGLLGHPTYHPTICDATSGEILQTFEDVRVRELAVMAFRADGRYLAVSGIFKDLSEVGRVRLYDVKTGELVRTIQHTAPVSAIAFSPNGTRLATGSYDTTVLIWDLTTKP